MIDPAGERTAKRNGGPCHGLYAEGWEGEVKLVNGKCGEERERYRGRDEGTKAKITQSGPEFEPPPVL